MSSTSHRSDLEERRGIVTNLLNLRDQGLLTTGVKRTVAASQGCTVRTVENWIANADQHDGVYTPRPRRRTQLTAEMRGELAIWCANRHSAYEALRERGEIDVTYSQFTRLVARDLAPGHLASFKEGTDGLYAYELRNSRGRGLRNQAWEADHLDSKVSVRLGNEIVQPQITHVDDASTNAICGLAITPHRPSSDAVLATLRDAVLRDADHGPFGGIPALIRVDRGSEFIGKAAGQAMNSLGIQRVIVRKPWQKGTVEAINGACTSTLLSGMRGWSGKPTSKGRPARYDGPIEDLLTWEQFVAKVLRWRTEWNTEHTMPALGGRTPLQAWQDDLTPLRDISRTALHRYTLQTDRPFHVVHPGGIRWKNADYYTDERWLRDCIGSHVRLRYTPHHRRTLQVYRAADDHYLGEVYLKDTATPEQKRAVVRGNRRVADRAKRDRERGERMLTKRYAATTEVTPAQPLDNLTYQEAEKELARLGITLPDETPEHLPDPTSSWGTTSSAPRQTEHPARPAHNLPAPTRSWGSDPSAPPPQATHPDGQETAS
ncbi:Mu transposase C-terminal domain-containing protein [Streptomyces albidoflavus]